MSSVYQYYKEKNYSPFAPQNRNISNVAVASTITIYTPTTGTRLAVTNLNVSANAAGTIVFHFGGNNDGQKLAEFSVGASSTISPSIGSWESTAINAPLVVRVSTALTNGWQVSVEGFELD